MTDTGPDDHLGGTEFAGDHPDDEDVPETDPPDDEEAEDHFDDESS